MAEEAKHKKVSLREILDEIEEDEAFSEEEMKKASDQALELEYKQWSLRLTKSNL